MPQINRNRYACNNRKFPVNKLKLVFVLLLLLTDAAVSPVPKNIRRTPLSYKCSQQTPWSSCVPCPLRDPAESSCSGLWLPRTQHSKTLPASVCPGAAKLWAHRDSVTGKGHRWVSCAAHAPGDPPCVQEQGQVMTTGEPLMLTAVSLNIHTYSTHTGKCLHTFIIPISTISQKLV